MIKQNFINLFTFFLILFSINLTGQKRFLYAGSYSGKDSVGIYVFEYDERTGHLSDVIHRYKIFNPSFLTISHNKKYLFAISENDEGSVSSYKIDHKTGALDFINNQMSNGSGPCHVQTDLNDKWCIIGHYGSGNIGVLPILENGSLGISVQSIQRYNDNPDKSVLPRVHSINIASNNKDIYVPDLGLDKILHYTLQNKGQPLKSSKILDTPLPKGSGPRHFAFHPDGKFAYCINEYTSKINVYKVQKDGLKDIAAVSTLPNDFKGKNYCADIHVSPDGKFVYGSNRGHNSIAIFAVNKTNGYLTLVGHQPTLGDFPRNFAIDPSGNFLLVANQKSDNIQIFKRNLKTGLLVHVQEVKDIHKPVCLKFL